MEISEQDMHNAINNAKTIMDVIRPIIQNYQAPLDNFLPQGDKP
jgi:hypothetical protein